MNNSSFIVVSSELSNISTINTWLEENLFKLIKNKEKISTLSLVIQEAIVNAIIHGNIQCPAPFIRPPPKFSRCIPLPPNPHILPLSMVILYLLTALYFIYTNYEYLYIYQEL